MRRKRKWLIVFIALTAALIPFFLFSVILFPQNFFDLRFEKMIREKMECGEKIDMRELTDFEWDTMYWFGDGYFAPETIKEIRDSRNILQETSHEVYGHIIFTKDGTAVKQYIVTRIELSNDAYRERMEGKPGTVRLSQKESVFHGRINGNTIILSPL